MVSSVAADRNIADSMFVGGTFDVEVSGVADTVIVARVAGSVRDTVGHLVGIWRVRVIPSPNRHRWDLRVHGPFGHHVAFLLSHPENLADTVARRLRSFLQSVVPPIGSGISRPTLVRRTQPHVPIRAAADRLPRASREFLRNAS
jgi:hypothetical protein